MAFSFTGIVDSFIGGILAPTVNRRQQFTQVLEEWWSTPAMPFLWVIVFDIPNLLSDASMNIWGEDIGAGPWGVDTALEKLHDKYEVSRNMAGCMFAQSVRFPGEMTDVDHAGIYNRGFTYAPVMTKRRIPQYLEINLLETNTSYVDAIVRPWLILSSHYGLVARPDGGSIKSNITAYELAKSGDSSKDIIKRKSWLFKDCVPSRVDDSTRKYDADQTLITRETWWQYTRYQAVSEFPKSTHIVQ